MSFVDGLVDELGGDLEGIGMQGADQVRGVLDARVEDVVDIAVRADRNDVVTVICGVEIPCGVVEPVRVGKPGKSPRPGRRGWQP
ncbi:hypothetical protein ACQP1O_34585 [Nocardia sp. CA-151230]|uniref:hypothetical protein n=1 Tax=Nocardia sp. CA-151230 TaxID=3239982 RepID=UPI003D92AAA6